MSNELPILKLVAHMRLLLQQYEDERRYITAVDNYLAGTDLPGETWRACNIDSLTNDLRIIQRNLRSITTALSRADQERLDAAMQGLRAIELRLDDYRTMGIVPELRKDLTNG